MDEARVASLVAEKLSGLDDGELYLQYTLSESFGFDDGRLKSATFDTTQGFGLRGVLGETTGFAHANELSEDAIRRAGDTVATIRTGREARWADAPARTNRMLYQPDNPFDGFSFETKTKLLADIDAYLRNKDPRVVQVSASLIGSWTVIEILRPDGYRAWDVRPLVRLNVQVIAQDGDRRESGFEGLGGRHDYSRLLSPATWQGAADEALRQALVNLQAVPAPAGEMTVVLGPGWPGVLLHEAIGHGLEGDFNRKGSSAFSGRIGERVAAPGVTVVDDGSLECLRGSITIDDEGTPTERTVLIEDGILKGYMQDRMNARLMGVKATGNGRRESFAHAPMPRMTNTFMLAGDRDPADILGSVKKGIYAKTFGGGQVDITSGKFVFSCTEAYELEDGKLGRPLKGATLIGNGPDVLTRVKAIGNDLALDPGIGVCGKGGQSVPAGVGQPTLLIEGLTVGGTG
ncbi:MAG TPA: metalloprotease TldD [Pedomonas sp.]|uniref:metalloprotease TldD n=1 Tax=Pedomonas sp. TaxID=2976421 RepID=UPI002F41D579